MDTGVDPTNIIKFKCGHSLRVSEFEPLFNRANNTGNQLVCPQCGGPILRGKGEPIDYYENMVRVAGLNRRNLPGVSTIRPMGQAEHERTMAEYWRQREIDRLEVEEEERLERLERQNRQQATQAYSPPVSQPQAKPSSGWFGGWFGFGAKNKKGGTKVHQDIKYLKSIK